jgi:hypothetical protein
VKKSTAAAIDLSENHRRSISITLQIVDKTLCEWEEWSNGHLRSGVMYREQDTLSLTQKIKLREKIATIRELMVRMRDDLQLPPSVVATSQPIMGHSSLLWEMLVDLDSRSLRAYGKISDDLARYVDPIGQALAAEMIAMTHLFSQPCSDETR